MSCDWPICQMGGSGCDDYWECEAEDRRRREKLKEQRERDIKEQELRIKLMEKQLKEKPK